MINGAASRNGHLFWQQIFLSASISTFSRLSFFLFIGKTHLNAKWDEQIVQLID